MALKSLRVIYAPPLIVDTLSHLMTEVEIKLQAEAAKPLAVLRLEAGAFHIKSDRLVKQRKNCFWLETKNLQK